ncbi:MAG: alpha/beta hydrolase [Clostridia bacterium]|nr:alpha/beta hydrolase [Clostridia bacterium]
MNRTIVYIHGQGGSVDEAEHYRALFPQSRVIGLDYAANTPWEAVAEFPKRLAEICTDNQPITLIANSIGAFFAMHALADKNIEAAYFISPVVDMEDLIENMMQNAGVSEEELHEKGEIQTEFGQTLSWEYLSYVRKHPIKWEIPTHILYGGKDHLTSLKTMIKFSCQIGATLMVMENGEHWFHTKEQMDFLDQWIMSDEEI